MADRIVVMNRGAIEQIGTPLEIYREPRSPFVADFIGVMNFVAGRVARPGTVRCGGLELACPADGYPPGTPVTVAIRPEDIGIQGVRGGEENSLPARIDALVFLGSFFRADLVGMETAEVRLRADVSVEVVRRSGLAEGHTLPIVLPRERLRIYPQSPVAA